MGPSFDLVQRVSHFLYFNFVDGIGHVTEHLCSDKDFLLTYRLHTIVMGVSVLFRSEFYFCGNYHIFGIASALAIFLYSRLDWPCY